MQTGRSKVGRIFINDNDSVGLRAFVGKREISYHVQFSIKHPKTGEVGARTTMMVGSYPDDSISVARERAVAARAMAEEGRDPRDLMRPSLMRHLDEVGETMAKKQKAARLLDDLMKAGVDFDTLNERLAKDLKEAKK